MNVKTKCGAVGRRLLHSAAIAALLMATPQLAMADAASDEQMAQMQAKLAEAMAAIQSLSGTVAALQSELGAQKAASATTSSNGDMMAELDERVEELEDTVDTIDSRVGSRAVANAFDATKLDIGGFVDIATTLAIGEDKTEAAFNREVFELLVKAKLGNAWDLFVAQAFIRNAPLRFSDPAGRRSPFFANNNSPVVTDTVIAWAQYSKSDMLNVQFGRFITPHGIINIEHFPANLLDPEQPQFLRPFPGQTIFANFSDGVNVHGSKFIGNNKFSYNAYAAAWAGNSSNVNVGGRLAYSFEESGLTFGLNGTYGDRSSTRDANFAVLGADVLFQKGRWTWKNEVYITDEENAPSKYAFYTMPAYKLTDKWTAFYRFDYLDTGLPGGESIENALGLTVRPIFNVHLRGIYRWRRATRDAGIPAADTHVFQLSTTFNF
ncbi:MAG: hypothetical protein COA84_07130 [Robiginitomaculum sp.]|nr:MAG: hypothetical protein COA84_07130 [Robiginitomaculum sp.]